MGNMSAWQIVPTQHSALCISAFCSGKYSPCTGADSVGVGSRGSSS